MSGPEERTADIDEAYEQDIDSLDVEQMIADEERSVDEVYHTNAFGEVIPHAVTVCPVGAKALR